RAEEDLCFVHMMRAQVPQSPLPEDNGSHLVITGGQDSREGAPNRNNFTPHGKLTGSKELVRKGHLTTPLENRQGDRKIKA
ncbi:MAG: hypothetical protein R6X33_06840, partial [Candidatus Brocadiia bacterium]